MFSAALRVGGDRTRRADAHIITATERNLKKEVAAGRLTLP
jgi:transcriptional regulator with GAF, ATPase, and Fis domain